MELIGGLLDGDNINYGVGSEYLEKFVVCVCEMGVWFGIVYDGDGDWCVLCDEVGGVFDGDEIFVILVMYVLV